MPDSSTNQDSRHRLVDVFVASVAVVAVVLTVVVYVDGARRHRSALEGPLRRHLLRLCCSSARHEPMVPIRRRRPSHARLGVRLQHRAAGFAARRDCGDGRVHALSSTFATTSRTTKIVFNAAQITASLAAGAFVLQLLGLDYADHRRRQAVAIDGDSGSSLPAASCSSPTVC